MALLKEFSKIEKVAIIAFLKMVSHSDLNHRLNHV